MSKILVTGADGLVGSALRMIHKDYPNHDFFFSTRANGGDLRNENNVASLYSTVRPEYVIHTAAKVGGLGINMRKPAEMFCENVLMNTLMIHYAHIFNVEKLICFSSVCTFPHDIVTLTEDLQQIGEPYVGNYAYGYSKRMADIQIRAYREQYGVSYGCFILTNTYGPYDNWNLDDGHVVPSLIHKCYKAKQNNEQLYVWGDGSSIREFIYSEDVARCAMKILDSGQDFSRIILSSGEILSIKELCKYVTRALSFDGPIVFDVSKSNGQAKRVCDNSLLKSVIGDFSFTSIQEGIQNLPIGLLRIIQM